MKRNSLKSIMDKTISNLEENSANVIELIHDLQSEYEKKMMELNTIKKQIPLIITQVDMLTMQDRQLRETLAKTSNHFSEDGYHSMQDLYEQTTEIHSQLLLARENEQSLVLKRNQLELDLLNYKKNINQAEFIAKHMVVSLTYLQSGMEQIEKEHDNIQSNASLAHYLSVFECIENEKSRIARDLHDGPIQQMISVQMRLDICKTIFHNDLMKGLSILDQLKSDLSLAIREVRSILFHLNPAPIEKVGLQRAIEALVMNTLDKQSIQVDLQCQITEQSILPTMETALYRIVQELLINIIKHAHASIVHIRLYQDFQFVYLIVEDNGLGFIVPDDFQEQFVKKKSYGLSNMQTKISELQGQLKIDSILSQGTTFKIQLPLIPTTGGRHE